MLTLENLLSLVSRKDTNVLLVETKTETSKGILGIGKGKEKETESVVLKSTPISQLLVIGENGSFLSREVEDIAAEISMRPTLKITLKR